MALVNHSALRVNEQRLWSRIQEMARIGATAGGGCNRQALTNGDRIARDLFCTWAREAGCDIRVDPIGNIFARRQGRKADAPAVMAGSHLDTQPTGGKFDGVYGVLAALEVIETLNAAGVETDHPVEAVVWTNEEGARFVPAMLGSGVYAGVFDLHEALETRDAAGVTLGSELARIGYAGEAPLTPDAIAAFEVHIEQGPILESQGKVVGVVRGVQGIRWYDIVIAGQPVHAGPTPMDVRRDPVRAMHAILAGVYALATTTGADARATIGDIRVEPASRNTVPAKVTVSLDLRHPEEAVLARMEQRVEALLAEAGDRTDTSCALAPVWVSPAVTFDARCVDSVRKASQAFGYPAIEMVSGAGHDSVYVSRVVPTAMIFVPCKGGISHNEAESAEPADLTAGANILLRTVLDHAGHCRLHAETGATLTEEANLRCMTA